MLTAADCVCIKSLVISVVVRVLECLTSGDLNFDLTRQRWCCRSCIILDVDGRYVFNVDCCKFVAQ